MRVPAKISIAIAALALLSGCGGEDETSSSTTTASTSAAATGPTGAEEAQPEAPPETAGGGGGAGGGEAASGPGGDPESALEAFFTSGDPDLVCAELATAKLLASAYGDERGCRQAQVPAAIPKAIEIEELESSGDMAEAIVVPEGGPNDGFEHEVVLVREGDSWLVDSLEADIPAGP